MVEFIKRLLLIIYFSLIFIPLFSQKKQQADSVIYWTKNRPLTFDDFKGKPGKEDTALHYISEKTLTHKLGAIIKSIDVQIIAEKAKITFTIRASMLKNLSWIKDVGDTISLKHEQGHFDICEVYAQMLRRDIRSAKSMDEAKEIYEEIMNKEELEQDDYDNENTFESGGITSEWNEKIKEQLNELHEYENPVVTISIEK